MVERYFQTHNQVIDFEYCENIKFMYRKTTNYCTISFWNPFLEKEKRIVLRGLFLPQLIFSKLIKMMNKYNY